LTKSLLLNVGTSDGKPVHFNLKKLKRSHLLITGASGSGKSYFERVIAEQIVGRVQTFIIDPEGEYVTLREKFPFLLVGEGGEVPIHPKTAGVLAQRLMKLGVSAIFDLSSMEVADQHLWVKNFVHALMQMKPKDTHDLVILVDESHLFCPEKGEGESVAKPDMLDLASRGRKRGFTNMWATQRLAKLANNAASELQNTCIGRVFLVDDREKAARILGIPQRSKMREEFYASLKVLDQGIFFAQGVAVSADLITFHVSEAQTRHPDPGERSSRRIVVPTPAQIKKLVPELAAIPVEAEEKEKSEKQLRAEIAEFKKQLRELKSELARQKIQPAPAAPAEMKKLREQGARLTRRVRDLKAALEGIVKTATKVTTEGLKQIVFSPDDFRPAVERVVSEVVKIAQKKSDQRNGEFQALTAELRKAMPRLAKLLSQPEDDTAAAVETPIARIAPESKQAHRPEGRNGDEGRKVDALNSRQLDILSALARFNAIGRTTVDKKWIAALAQVSHTSGAFGNNLGALRSAGYIEYPQAGAVSLTPAGREIAPEVDAPASAQEMLDQCKAIVSKPAGAILQVLADAYPDTLAKNDIAEKSGVSPTSGAFGNNLGALRSAGMISYPSTGTAKLESWVMLDE
jgi:hypothetical protein